MTRPAGPYHVQDLADDAATLALSDFRRNFTALYNARATSDRDSDPVQVYRGNALRALRVFRAFDNYSTGRQLSQLARIARIAIRYSRRAEQARAAEAQACRVNNRAGPSVWGG